MRISWWMVLSWYFMCGKWANPSFFFLSLILITNAWIVYLSFEVNSQEEPDLFFSTFNNTNYKAQKRININKHTHNVYWLWHHLIASYVSQSEALKSSRTILILLSSMFNFVMQCNHLPKNYNFYLKKLEQSKHLQ